VFLGIFSTLNLVSDSVTSEPDLVVLPGCLLPHLLLQVLLYLLHLLLLCPWVFLKLPWTRAELI